MTNFVKETSNENLVKKDGLVPSASGLNTTIYRLPVGSSEKVAAILVDSETGNVDIRASDGTSFVKVDARNKKAFLGDTDIIAGIEGAKDIASNASSVALQDIRQNGLYLQHNKKLTTREDGQLLIDGRVFKGEKGEAGPTPDIEETSNGVKIKGGNQELVVKHGDPGATGPAPSVERFDQDGRTGVAITGENGTKPVYDGEKGENAPGVEADIRAIKKTLNAHTTDSKTFDHSLGSNVRQNEWFEVGHQWLGENRNNKRAVLLNICLKTDLVNLHRSVSNFNTSFNYKITRETDGGQVITTDEGIEIIGKKKTYITLVDSIESNNKTYRFYIQKGGSVKGLAVSGVFKAVVM